MAKLNKLTSLQGSIKIPFNNSTVLEVEGAGNGLLALLRALHYLNVAVTKNSFDSKFPFEGIMMIKIGEVTRKGMGLSVNGKYDQANSLRIATGYKDLLKKYKVEGFPTIKLDRGNNDIVELDAKPSEESLSQFLHNVL